MIATARRCAQMMAPSLKAFIGDQNYRKLRSLFNPSLRFDEVAIVCNAIARQRGCNGIMLDVGTHRGESAESFAAHGWTTHCFEPNPVNWPVINKRILKRFPKARLFQVALGEFAEANRLLSRSLTRSLNSQSLSTFGQSQK